MANLEALWVAGQLKPGKKIVASAQAHYTHHRISSVLQLEFESVPVDVQGAHGHGRAANTGGARRCGTVVATLGTRRPVLSIPYRDPCAAREARFSRAHRCAYGGYSDWSTISPRMRDLRSLASSMSIRSSSIRTKHGLQPYGCGCVLFRDPNVGSLYKHDSPYTYFSSAELHLGEISLECSRPGAPLPRCGLHRSCCHW